MQFYRMKLCDKKCPAFSINEQRLQDENREIEAFENYLRWNFYETRKFW